MARRGGATETAPRPTWSALAPGLKSTSTRGNAPDPFVHLRKLLKWLASSPPSERTKGNKPLIRKVFSPFFYSHIVTQNVSNSFRANLHCLISRVLQRLLLWSLHLYLNQGHVKENHYLLTRGQLRSPA